jgi:hypothetical protein
MVIGEATSHNELIAVMRQRKDALGLSNGWIDDALSLADGHTDKILGPAQERGLTQLTLDGMLSVLALKLVVAEDDTAATRMRPLWERRDHRQVRPPARIAASLVKRAKPLVMREAAKAAAAARWRRTTPELRRQIMDAVWRSRRNVRAHQEASAAATKRGKPS